MKLTVDTTPAEFRAEGLAGVATRFDRMHEQLFTFALDAGVGIHPHVARDSDRRNNMKAAAALSFRYSANASSTIPAAIRSLRAARADVFLACLTRNTRSAPIQAP